MVAAGSGDAHEVPGWYGKLASLGDFAHRRLPSQWREACDGWLSGVMRGGLAGVGERWLEAYLTAPVLRFAWAPGVVDGQWWFGALMPSCDSVGRYFPLLIAQARPNAPQDRIGLDHLERWYEHVAGAAMATLEDGHGSVDALEAALREAPPWPTSARGPVLVSHHGPAGDRHRLGRAAPLSHWLQLLAAHELTERLGGCTVWWRVGPVGSDDSIDLVRGLPDGGRFTNLLTGEPPP
jgi:type VI secretion system protein ImpM